MSNFILLIASLAMVSMAAADGDYQIGQIHLLEKSYWYDCPGGVCTFKKCIVEYNQAGNGPEKCITPKDLYELHKEAGSLDKLDQRNCYDIRKTYYDSEYKGKDKYIKNCEESEDVTISSPSKNKKSICNVRGKTATHYYDSGFYKCEKGEDFILQGCEFPPESAGSDKKCLSYSATQAEVDGNTDLQQILANIETALKTGGDPPRAACYQLAQNSHFAGNTVPKTSCDFKNFDPSAHLKDAIKEAKEADKPPLPATTTTAAPAVPAAAAHPPGVAATREEVEAEKRKPAQQIPENAD